jgi:hypothetical protein
VGTNPPNPFGRSPVQGSSALLVVDGFRHEVAFLGPPLPACGAERDQQPPAPDVLAETPRCELAAVIGLQNREPLQFRLATAILTALSARARCRVWWKTYGPRSFAKTVQDRAAIHLALPQRDALKFGVISRGLAQRGCRLPYAKSPGFGSKLVSIRCATCDLVSSGRNHGQGRTRPCGTRFRHTYDSVAADTADVASCPHHLMCCKTAPFNTVGGVHARVGRVAQVQPQPHPRAVDACRDLPGGHGLYSL